MRFYKLKMGCHNVTLLYKCMEIIVLNIEHNLKMQDISGPGCSKLTSLVNAALKFQTLISEICQYFF